MKMIKVEKTNGKTTYISANHIFKIEKFTKSIEDVNYYIYFLDGENNDYLRVNRDFCLNFDEIREIIEESYLWWQK